MSELSELISRKDIWHVLPEPRRPLATEPTVKPTGDTVYPTLHCGMNERDCMDGKCPYRECVIRDGLGRVRTYGRDPTALRISAEMRNKRQKEKAAIAVAATEKQHTRSITREKGEGK